MKLWYKNAAEIDLHVFVDHYRNAFRELYRDTGLWNESLIVAAYELSALKLYDNISGAIEEQLSQKKVLGRKAIAGNWFEVHISVGGRLAIVYYTEDKRENVRWVESISIDRKPIIF